jgi:hypothetical protein
MVPMRIVIEGFELPGRTFCAPDGSPLMNVHVGVQIKADPSELVSGDAKKARWEVDVRVSEQPDGRFDFHGPAVHGRRGERFMYLTWGSVDDDGGFHMFRRAKLMLDRIDPELVVAAERQALPLIARIRLTDDRGGPRCARVDPPDLTWALSRTSASG